MNQHKGNRSGYVISLIEEEWRVIVGYKKLYFVSSMGRIKRKELWGEVLCNQKNDKDGYKIVSLPTVLGTPRQVLKKVHRLVAEAFIPNPDNKPMVNHKDTVKHNNSLRNLEWATEVENMQHAHKHIVFKHAYGTKNYKTILTIQDINDIFNLRKAGLLMKEIAKKYNVQTPTICDILNRRTWKHLKQTAEGAFYE